MVDRQGEPSSNKEASFWQERGEREFILILLLSLVIIGFVLWFSFSNLGRQTGGQVLNYIGERTTGSYNFLTNYFSEFTNFQIRADEEVNQSLLDQNKSESIVLSDLKINQIKPEIIKAHSISLDKIKNSIYNKREKNINKAVASGKPVYTEGKYLDIDLSSQTMTLYKKGINKGNYLVSTGSAYYPTPTGEYSINSKSFNAYSAKYGLYMPYWMAFIGSSYGIHELPETPSGIKEGASSLGVPVSHGCIRLGVGAAARVYQFAPVGTRVFIHQ